MGTGFLPRVKSGRGVTLTPHPLLVPMIMKEESYTSTPPMGRTACIEPQCLYMGALYLSLISIYGHIDVKYFFLCLSVSLSLSMCVCACVCVRARAFACVCVCKKYHMLPPVAKYSSCGKTMVKILELWWSSWGRKYISVTSYWGYMIILWLFYLVCILHCGCCNLFCNVWVCVCVWL